MLQTQALPSTQDFVVVVSVKCQKADHATLSADLTHLIGEAKVWVGGLESS